MRASEQGRVGIWECCACLLAVLRVCVRHRLLASQVMLKGLCVR